MTELLRYKTNVFQSKKYFSNIMLQLGTFILLFQHSMKLKTFLSKLQSSNKMKHNFWICILILIKLSLFYSECTLRWKASFKNAFTSVFFSTSLGWISMKSFDNILEVDSDWWCFRTKLQLHPAVLVAIKNQFLLSFGWKLFQEISKHEIATNSIP